MLHEYSDWGRIAKHQIPIWPGGWPRWWVLRSAIEGFWPRKSEKQLEIWLPRTKMESSKGPQTKVTSVGFEKIRFVVFRLSLKIKKTDISHFCIHGGHTLVIEVAHSAHQRFVRRAWEKTQGNERWAQSSPRRSRQKRSKISDHYKMMKADEESEEEDHQAWGEQAALQRRQPVFHHKSTVHFFSLYTFFVKRFQPVYAASLSCDLIRSAWRFVQSHLYQKEVINSISCNSPPSGQCHLDS